MKRYANSNSDITLLAYKNSANFQKTNINNQRKQIKHRLTNVHEVNYKQVVQTLKKENSLRVEKSENGEWDLVKSVTITPSKLIIDTEHSSMIFEEGDMTRAKIRRNLDDE